MSESVYCACGAQWHGKYAHYRNAVITAHAQNEMLCRGGCQIITHERFVVHHRCKCDACADTRKHLRNARKLASSEAAK